MGATDLIFHFWHFIALLFHYWPQKLKFGKYVRSTWRYHPFSHVYNKWRSYDVWFLRYKAWRTEFFVILSFFSPLTLLTTKRKHNFEKMKTAPRDIFILHMPTINDNHMMYGSWNMEWNWHNCLSFWAIFCLFISLTTRNIKILEKWVKCLEILSVYKCVLQMIIIWCMVPEIQGATDRFFCQFRLFFAFYNPSLSPLTTWKTKILIKWKHAWICYYHFTYVNQKWKSYDLWFLRYGARQT